MLYNYVKVAIRNLIKNKAYSFINIGGLAVGMAIALLIGFWIWDEVTFNRYHSNYERLGMVRNLSTHPSTGITEGSEFQPIPMGMAIKDNYKHLFDKVAIAWWIQDFALNSGEKKLKRTGEFIQPEALEMLSLKMLKGTYAALSDPHSIILSRTTAEAIFGTSDPINQSLKIDNLMDVKVTGIYEDLPKNSTFGSVQFFAPWALWVSSNEWVTIASTNWGNTSFHIYVERKPEVSWETVQASIKDFYLKNSPKEFIDAAYKYKSEVYVYPMSQWHLYSDFTNGLPDGGRITFVWLFGIIGAFVLLLACINFMNLSTARSEKRSKEVGIRKAIGSLRTQLMSQFFSESFLVVVLAFVGSLLFVTLSLPWFNNLADKDIAMPFTNGYFWACSLAFVLMTGLITGLYPAVYLSSFQPIQVLKGTFRMGRWAVIPRKALVVIQFTVSVILIVGTLVVYQQIEHARNRPVGYNREGLVTVPLNDPNYKGKYDVLKRELSNTGVVSAMALSNSPLTEIRNVSGGFTWQGKDPEAPSGFVTVRITHDFGKMVDWQFLAGRDFSTVYSTDSTAIILNETAATRITQNKYPIHQLLGQTIKYDDNSGSWHVVGIIKDMIVLSPYEPVGGTFYFLDAGQRAKHITLKISPNVSANAALPKIETVFRNIVPSALFDYKFVDQEYAQKFSTEQRIGKLSMLFALLAIFISCLGLFGLASFVAEQRTKEIGIRKVLGASVINLWQMLSKEFIVLVSVSCLLAAPVAWYFMNGWLEKYTYRIEISVWIFIIAGLGALVITLLTVSYQAIKAALANPVKSLRSE